MNIKELNQNVNANQKDGYLSLCCYFCDLFRQENDGTKKIIYKALYEVCLLQYDVIKELYKPGYKHSENSSYSLDDFSDIELEYLENIASQLESIILKARIYDVLWERGKVFKNAQLAIEEYKKIEINNNTFFVSAPNCLQRLIHLAGKLLSRNPTEQKIIYDKLINAIVNCNEEGYHLSIHLIDVYMGIRFMPRLSEIICHINKCITHLTTARDAFYLAKFVETLFSLYRGSSQLSFQNLNYCADAMVEAGRMSEPMIKIKYLYRSIDYLKLISSDEKSLHKTLEKIQSIELEIENTRPLVQLMMKPVATAPIAVKIDYDFLEQRFSTSDEDKLLELFATLLNEFDYKKAECEAIKQLSSSFSATFDADYLSDDGRKIAQSQGINLCADVDPSKVLASIANSYLPTISCSSFLYILPSLNILHAKCNISLHKFEEIAFRNPYISLTNYKIVAAGLYAGFNYDFLTALHLLSFQLEDFVRNFLKSKGINTIAHDRDNVESEKGLSTLIKDPTFETFFGKNYTFEIAILFAESLGANIRNNIAHGLVPYNSFKSDHYVYAWWLILKLFHAIYRKVKAYDSQSTSGNS